MRVFVFAFSLSGCALVSGLSEVKVQTNDASSGTEAATDATSTCPQSCGVVPEGWQAVARLKDSAGTCGARGAVDFATGADMTSACPCTCAVGTMPSCIGADHGVKFGDQCSISGTFVGNKCSLPQVSNIAGAYALTPFPPTGGTCNAPSTSPNPNATLKVRACSMPQGCAGAPCPSADETACIVHAGSVACPTDYSMSTTVGTDVAVSCSCSGSCSLQASCTSPALHFYSDTACTNEISQAPADGNCNANGGSGKPLGSYLYVATVNALCSGSGVGAPKVDLVGASTLCCKP